MMTEEERKSAEMALDSLSKIIAELKIAYYNAKNLESNHGWDINCLEICETYMDLSSKFIYIIMKMLEEEENGGDK